MDQNYSSTKLPTAASQTPSDDGAAWLNPSNITADDTSSATLGYFNGGDFGATIYATDFDFQQMHPSAVIDGIQVDIYGSQTGCYGNVNLDLAGSGSGSKDMASLNTSYGGPADLWGMSVVDPADIASLSLSVDTGDVSGGDGIASIEYLEVTVYWHIELDSAPADVPTRIAYKVYSKDGNYLGELPDVTSKFGFPQDINSAGSSILITCGKYVTNEVTVTPLLTEGGDIITTENDLPITVTNTEVIVATGDAVDEAIYKNGNRIKIWLYNKYYPNGKLEFSGQVNRVEFKYGGGDASVKLTVYSDGLDLNNYIARGFPFSYTTDVSNPNQNTYAAVTQDAKGAGWQRYGQSWVAGAGVSRLGAISVMLRGSADVTITVFDAVNGNTLGSVTKSVVTGATPTVEQFAFPNLIDVVAGQQYFFAISVSAGQSIIFYCSDGNQYSGGSMYVSSYGGGSGGGLYTEYSYLGGAYDLYFITYSGAPTTTVTYSTDDPVADMAHGILLDYNSRGGYVTERDFTATGLSLTYTFVVSTIFDALRKIIEMCQTGYYAYVDIGTAEIDIKQVGTTPDYTVVRGRHVYELNIAMSIEQVKNYLLLSGGDIGGGVNLYQDYAASDSVSNYGIRTGVKSDNRITLAATADAVGQTFIEENSDEVQQTTLTVLGKDMDITQLTPGKTVGFKNFGNFIDDLVLQIVRREVNYSDDIVTLTLGRMPIRMSDQIERINRGLLNEQTINNPTAPS